MISIASSWTAGTSAASQPAGSLSFDHIPLEQWPQRFPELWRMLLDRLPVRDLVPLREVSSALHDGLPLDRMNAAALERLRSRTASPDLREDELRALPLPSHLQPLADRGLHALACIAQLEQLVEGVMAGRLRLTQGCINRSTNERAASLVEGNACLMWQQSSNQLVGSRGNSTLQLPEGHVPVLSNSRAFQCESTGLRAGLPMLFVHAPDHSIHLFDRSAAALVTLPKELSLHRREPQVDAYYLQRPALSCNGRFVVVTKAHAASTTVSLFDWQDESLTHREVRLAAQGGPSVTDDGRVLFFSGSHAYALAPGQNQPLQLAPATPWASFTRDGRFLIDKFTAAYGLQLTDLRTGHVCILEGPGSRIGAVAFSPLCALALVVDEFNVCRLYRLDSTAAHCPPLDTFSLGPSMGTCHPLVAFRGMDRIDILKVTEMPANTEVVCLAKSYLVKLGGTALSD